MEGCLLQIVELHDDASRLAEFAPPPFRVARFYGPTTGALSVWTFSCSHVRVPDGGGGPGRISIVAVQIDRPDGPAPAISYLHNFDFYVISARTDRRDLAKHAQHSITLDFADGITFDRTAGVLPRSTAEVPGKAGRYRVEVAPSLQHPVHEHDNSFWRLSPNGAMSELQLNLLNAIDKWCPYRVDGCSRVEVESSTALSALLGSEARTDGLGIDHDPVPTGTMRFL